MSILARSKRLHLIGECLYFVMQSTPTPGSIMNCRSIKTASGRLLKAVQRG
jgi:hypothetical protein